MFGVKLHDGIIAILYADYSDILSNQQRLERAMKMEALGTVVASVSDEFKNILALLELHRTG